MSTAATSSVVSISSFPPELLEDYYQECRSYGRACAYGLDARLRVVSTLCAELPVIVDVFERETGSSQA